MGQIGSMWYNIGAKTADLEKGLANSKSQLGGVSSAFQSVTGFSLGMAGAAGIAATAIKKTIDYMVMCEKAANEASVSEAKLNAVLISTGHQAGITSTELNKLSQQISLSAGIDDELVTSAEAVLLTFTKINKDVFPDTLKAAADMSAVLGQDLQSSVTMIGKAMNDFSGYTALKRAGVSFSEEQIREINNFKAANDVIGYQNLLLQELQTEYGGAAIAINQAGDASANLKVATENLHEAIGRVWMTDARNINELLFIMKYNMAESENASADFGDSMEELGYTFIASGIYVKDWKFTTAAAMRDTVDEYQKTKQAAEELAAAQGVLLNGIKSYTSRGSIYDQQYQGGTHGTHGSIYDSGINAGGANGLSMVVPAGFPNDSFRVGATSGESIEITKGGGNNQELLIEIQGMRRELNRLPLALRDAYLFAQKAA
jgi:hypothetical protein